MTLLAGLLLSTALAADWTVDAETDQGALSTATARVTASSVLVEKGRAADRYAPVRAVDGDLATCWCRAKGTAGHGEGEWLEIALAQPARVKALRVYPGCGAQDRVWLANNRIRALDVTVGDKTTRVPLADQRRLQDLGVSSAGPVTTIRLTVRAVQDATTKYDDTCIGEVQADLE